MASSFPAGIWSFRCAHLSTCSVLCRSPGAAQNSQLRAVQEVSSQQVSAGSLPKTLALEGVRMRYLTDARVDEMLAEVYAAATAPPLLHNPFGRVVSIVRQYGCRMEAGYGAGGAGGAAQGVNELTRVGPPGSFIYAGARREARRDAHVPFGMLTVPRISYAQGFRCAIEPALVQAEHAVTVSMVFHTKPRVRSSKRTEARSVRLCLAPHPRRSWRTARCCSALPSPCIPC